MDLITGVTFVAGFFLLIGGAELLVRGAANLAIAAGITPLVVGLTVVAYGTSAPELAVSIQSGLAGSADIAIGNVVGSNIANVLLILGLSAIITPLTVSQQLVRLEVPLMIGLSVILLLMGLDGQLNRLEGILLASGGIAYSVFAVWQSRRQQAALAESDGSNVQVERNVTTLMGQVGLIIIGLILLVAGANWLVNGAVTIARLVGLSELIIGLTIVAVGTSLPEIATSIMAAKRGERDIAVGNVVGSNIFNILMVLGFSAAVLPNGVPVSPSALYFDIPIMIAVAFACLPIFFTGYAIDRWEGWLFIGYYIAYTSYLVLYATNHDGLLPLFNNVMLLFVIPLTVITILISVWQHNQLAKLNKHS